MMSEIGKQSCWMCGQPTEEGQVECDKCSNVTVTHDGTLNVRKIDWMKVHSLDDIKRVLTVFGMSVVVGSPAEEALREFLED